MDKEDHTFVVTKGNLYNGIGERRTPGIKKGHEAFVQRAIAINKTSKTKEIRIGVVVNGITFIPIEECKELDRDRPCKATNIHLSEYQYIEARFEGVQNNDDLILWVEGTTPLAWI